MSSAFQSAAHTEANPPITSHRWLYCILALLCFAAPVATAAAADIPDLDLRLARQEAVITTDAGRTFRGLLDGMRDGRVFIRRVTDGGEVGYSFVPEKVREFTIPGTTLAAEAVDLWEHGEITDALPLLEALGRQRFRYLPLLNREQRRPLLTLVAAKLETGDPRAAIAYVGLMRPHAITEREASELRDAELTAYVNLGLTAETRALAQDWCAEADPTEGSALGWRILVQLEYEAGDFDRALWTALQPIVASTYLPLEELNACYAFAIASADQLGDQLTALRLYREMRKRNLEWPRDLSFDSLALRYATFDISGESANDGPPEAGGAPTSGPRDDAESLTFADVRKLMKSQGSTSP